MNKLKAARRILVIATAVMLSSLVATGQWWSGDTRVPDEPWRKSNGTFGAMLLLTPDFEKFLKEWKKPDVPTIKITKTAHRNKRLDAAIIFTGCSAREGNCNVVVDFFVAKPDGTEYGSAKDVAAWVKHRAIPRGIVQVSEATLAIIIEPQDPGGTYTVKARVRDINAGTELELIQTLTVMD